MKGKWLLVPLGVVVVLSLATIQGCFQPPFFSSDGHVIGNLQCSDVHVPVLPGQYVKLRNPCPMFPGATIDGRWVTSEIVSNDFSTGDCNNDPFPGVVNGISLHTCFPGTQCPITKDIPDEPERFLVADLTAQPKVDFPICYIYHDYVISSPLGFSNVGRGTLFVTTGAPLTVSTTASPTTVAAGNTSQLKANPTGGVPPYSFAWSPTASLSDPTLANPVAKPGTTTAYTVKVTDSTNQTASSSVTVTVSSSSSFTLTVVSLADPKLNLYVFSSPMGIQCFQGANCSAPFSAGTKVILTAEASSATWTGCDTFTNSTCTVAMNADRKVTVSSP